MGRLVHLRSDVSHGATIAQCAASRSVTHLQRPCCGLWCNLTIEWLFSLCTTRLRPHRSDTGDPRYRRAPDGPAPRSTPESQPRLGPTVLTHLPHACASKEPRLLAPFGLEAYRAVVCHEARGRHGSPSPCCPQAVQARVAWGWRVATREQCSDQLVQWPTALQCNQRGHRCVLARSRSNLVHRYTY